MSINAPEMAIHDKKASHSRDMGLWMRASPYLPFLPDDCLAGVAALEPRESVAAIGHVVAPLQRGYVSPLYAAESA